MVSYDNLKMSFQREIEKEGRQFEVKLADVRNKYEYQLKKMAVIDNKFEEERLRKLLEDRERGIDKLKTELEDREERIEELARERVGVDVEELNSRLEAKYVENNKKTHLSISSNSSFSILGSCLQILFLSFSSCKRLPPLLAYL